MTRNLTIFLLLVIVGCTSRPSQTIENSTVQPGTASNKNEIKKKSERLFDFYYSFADEKKFQLERTKFPLTIENYDKVYKTNKDDWKQDLLFTNLEYITFIYNSHTKKFDYDEKTGNKAAFSWIYPLKGEIKNYYFIKETDKWYLTKISVQALDNKNPESFIVFLQKFMSDSIFQKSRVKFPLTYLTFDDSDDESKEITEKLNPDDWNFNTIYDGLKFMTNFSSSWNTEIKESENMLIYIGGVENGIYIRYFFNKLDKKWYLTKMSDESM